MEIKAEEKNGTISKIVINDTYTLYHNVDEGTIEVTKNDIYDDPGSKLRVEVTDDHNAIFW